MTFTLFMWLGILAAPAFSQAPADTVTAAAQPASATVLSAPPAADAVPAGPPQPEGPEPITAPGGQQDQKADGEPPVPPEALVAIGGDKAVTLSWLPSPSKGIIGYNVYRTTETGKFGVVPINKSMVTGTEFLDNRKNSTDPPQNGVVYFYMVKAINTMGVLSAASEESRGRPEGAPVITEIPKVGWKGFGESQLSVSGRKVVSMGFTVRTPKYAPGTSQLSGPQSQRLNLEQQLQVRLSGSVGKKINVDVDYDDTAPDQSRQRISVVYAGEPEETIERAEFGDIRLKLSDTEFTGYDKQLFGVRIQAKPIDRLRLTAIATQTQGINASEQFVGNSSKQELEIWDSSYISYRYFYITSTSLVESHLGIKPGTEEIWMDDGNVSNNTVNTTMVGSYAFDLLYQGLDYSIDYNTGVLVFNRSISQSAAMAVKFEYGDGTRVEFWDTNHNSVSLDNVDPDHLISSWDISNTSWAETSSYRNLIFDGRNSMRGDAHMITNRYQLPYRNIVPKEFDSEFTIKILDASGNEITEIVDPVFDSEFYDFGILKVRGWPGRGLSPCDKDMGENIDGCPTLCGPPVSEQPFAYDPANNFYCVNGNAYMYGDKTGRIPRYRIKMRFLTRVLSYRLKNINIVRGSERIRMDERLLTRDVDYFIDYDFGQITFLRPEQIRYDSRIQIDYEYLPFGGQFQSFLWGARAQYSASEKSALGVTYLTNSAQAPQDAPSPTAAPKDTSIAGVDGRTFLSRRDLSNFIQVLPGFENSVMPVEMELHGEVARSDINPNSYNPAGVGEKGVAMIDAMEGVDDTIEAGVEHSLWFPSAPPVGFTRTRTEELAWHTGEGGHYSNLSRTLDIKYFGLDENRWDGLRYVFSGIGLDLSNFQYLEMWLYGDGKNEQLAVSLGVINENSNVDREIEEKRDETLDTEDLNGDFVLNTGEDTGTDPGSTADASSVYWGKEGAFQRYPAWPGPGGNLLNTEDMNNNGVLDKGDNYFEYKFRVTWTGWNYVKIPLSFDASDQTIAVKTEKNPNLQVEFSRIGAPSKSVIRAARVWLTAPDNTSANPIDGTIQLESLRVTGNRWLLRTNPGSSLFVDSSRFNVSAINQESNMAYVPLLTFFRVQEEDAELREQALQIDYSLYDDLGGNYYASRTFPAPINMRDYRELRLDINKQNVRNYGEILFVRVGGDERNYYQFNVPLDNVGPGWQTVSINLEDARNQTRVGVAALSGVKQISIGVIRYDPPLANLPETIWVNNLRLVSPKHKTGVARKVSVRLATPMGTTYIIDPSKEIAAGKAGVVADVTYRELDNDFRLIDQPMFLHNDQHRKTMVGTVQVRQIPKLPVTVNWQTQEAYVEPQHRHDPAYFFWPDREAGTYKIAVSSKHFAPVAMDVTADRNVESVKFLTNLAGANYEMVNWSVSPRLRAPLDGWFYFVPLGKGGELSGAGRYTKDRLTYEPSEVFSNLLNRRNEMLDEQYDARTTYRPLMFLGDTLPVTKGFSLAPRAGFRMRRTKGVVGAVQVANITNPNLLVSDDRLHPVTQDVNVGLEGRLDGVKGITPSSNYSGLLSKNFSLFNMNTKTSLRNNLNVNPGDWFKGIGRPSFSLSYAIETAAQYYDVPDSGTRHIREENSFTDKVTFEEIWGVGRKNDDISTANTFSETYTIGGRIPMWKLLQVTPNYMFREDTRLAQKLRTRQTNNTVSTSVSLLQGKIIQSFFNFTPLFWMKFSGFDSQYHFRKTLKFDAEDEPINITESHQAQASIPFNPIRNMRGNIGLMGERSVSRIPPHIRSTKQSVRPSIGLGYTTNAGVTIPLIWAKLRLSNLITVRHNFQMNFIKDEAEGQRYGNRRKRELQDVTEFEYEMLRGVSLRMRAQIDEVKDFTQPAASFKAYSLFGTFLFNF